MANFTPDGQMQTTWHIRVGATFTKKYQWKTGDPAVPVALSTWVARVHIREKASSATTILELTTENGAITLDDAGNINIEISESQTKTLAAYKKAVFDLELESLAGFVRNLVGGPVTLYGNVTREEA